jgi:tRNA threonylcarbamoyl adenosine modification protein YeaZ
MRLLAIDSALPAVSVCVLDSRERTPLAVESTPMARGHAEAIMPMIERVVGATDEGFAALDRIAATTGPGSFTGIRVGLAAARSIGLALGKPVVGVSTLRAFAAPLLMARDARPVFACVDARHGQVYAQMFDKGGAAMSAPSIMPVGEAAAMVRVAPCRLTGDAARAVAEAARATGARVEIASDAPCPDIAFVAMLGLLAEAGDGRPRPLYLKAVDAKPMAAAAR